jgi:hypothetical protein
MKKLFLGAFMTVLGLISCNPKPDCCGPMPDEAPACIQTKINAMVAANRDFTSVKRYKQGSVSFWLFDTGSAFDGPRYMLNETCDTVCTWCFCPSISNCHANYNLSDSTAVVLWKK